MKKTAVILFSIFYFLFSHPARAAVLYSGVANQDVYEGQTFVVDWFLDTEAKPINSLDLKLNFSKETLEVSNTGAGNSLISLWIKNPTADNNAGSIELTGGIPNGGISNKLPIFRMTVRAKSPGLAFINLDPSSIVLLNDGLGSNEPLKFKNEAFNVFPKGFLPMQITSPSHPNPNAWYKNHNVAVKFTPKPGEDYSYSFSSNIEIVPDNQFQTVPSEIKYQNMPDGVYYFKLNSKVGSGNLPAGQAGWKEAGVFRVQIDSTPPELFTPAISSDSSVFAGSSFVSFSTVDKTSGISYYKVKVGLFGRNLETQSPHKISKPLIGDFVRVSAIDEAGNVQTATIAYPGYVSSKFFEWILVLIGICTIAIIFRKQIIKLITKKNEHDLSS